MVSQTNKPIDAYIDLKAKRCTIYHIYMYYIIKTLDVRLKNSI